MALIMNLMINMLVGVNCKINKNIKYINVK